MPQYKKPLVALIALDDDVRLGILPHSNKFILEGSEDNLCAAIEFNFRKGEILLIHPVLIHYGCAYKPGEKALRAHYYFDNPTLTNKVGKQGERTYLLRHKIQSMPKNQQIEKVIKIGKTALQNANRVAKEKRRAAKEAKEKAAKVAENTGETFTIKTRKQRLASNISLNNIGK